MSVQARDKAAEREDLLLGTALLLALASTDGLRCVPINQNFGRLTGLVIVVGGCKLLIKDLRPLGSVNGLALTNVSLFQLFTKVIFNVDGNVDG